ncbi:MAG: PAAR domain-containing protein [Nannocystaceae bacterium]
MSAPVDAINLGLAEATAGIARALPALPAATLGSLVIGFPHGHPHPPSFGVPLPPIGPIALGCCVSVLIGGLPAARVGDLGLSPTCLGYFPQFEIFTGSSKVFIGGSRAARVLDLTMHCWPAKEWMARGAIAALVRAAKAGQAAMGIAGKATAIAGIVADVGDAIEAEAAGQGAMASAHALSAGMAAAQRAADQVAEAIGALMGKDPAVGPPAGAVAMGDPTVHIGGFPMPSGSQIAGRSLSGAQVQRRRRGKGEEREQGAGSCPLR